jgi:hypothetical protein
MFDFETKPLAYSRFLTKIEVILAEHRQRSGTSALVSVAH